MAMTAMVMEKKVEKIWRQYTSGVIAACVDSSLLANLHLLFAILPCEVVLVYCPLLLLLHLLRHLLRLLVASVPHHQLLWHLHHQLQLPVTWL